MSTNVSMGQHIVPDGGSHSSNFTAALSPNCAVACMRGRPQNIRVCMAQESGVWQSINRCKALVVEPKGSADEFNKAIKRFRHLVDSGKGAVFMAVCRGKVCTCPSDAANWLTPCT